MDGPSPPPYDSSRPTETVARRRRRPNRDGQLPVSAGEREPDRRAQRGSESGSYGPNGRARGSERTDDARASQGANDDEAETPDGEDTAPNDGVPEQGMGSESGGPGGAGSSGARGGSPDGDPGPGDRRDELCDECGRETPHRVTIEHRTMSRRDRNREFSRQPYRVSRCVVCGHTSTERLW